MDLKFVHPSDLHAYLERPLDPNIKLHSYPSKRLPTKISDCKVTYVPGDQAVVEDVIEPFLAKEEVVSVETVAAGATLARVGYRSWGMKVAARGPVPAYW